MGFEKADGPVLCEVRTHLAVPPVSSTIAAGFPSPADDYLDRPLDFNALLIAHQAATLAVRVAGDSMIGVGIFPGDIAVVDRAVKAVDGKIILGTGKVQRWTCLIAENLRLMSELNQSTADVATNA